MKKFLYTLPFILLVISLSYIHSGCKSDDVVTPPVDQNVDKESTTSKNFTQLTKLLCDANSNAWQYLNIVPPTSCPDYFFDSTFYSAIVVRYGDFPFGCAGVDGVRRSGSYIITPHIFSGGDSVYFTLSLDRYFINKYAINTDTNTVKVNGSLNFSTKKISGTTYNFHAGGECSFTTNLGVNKYITLTGVNGTVNYNSLNTISDDAYSIYGTVKINDSGFGTEYTLTVNQSSALQISGNCLYPLSGIAGISAPNTNATCDFSPASGTCDAIVKLTKGGASTTVDLTNTDF